MSGTSARHVSASRTATEACRLPTARNSSSIASLTFGYVLAKSTESGVGLQPVANANAVAVTPVSTERLLVMASSPSTAPCRPWRRSGPASLPVARLRVPNRPSALAQPQRGPSRRGVPSLGPPRLIRGRFGGQVGLGRGAVWLPHLQYRHTGMLGVKQAKSQTGPLPTAPRGGRTNAAKATR